jgi:aromatic-L-amino-acid/L-tryptophan decarboxylase
MRAELLSAAIDEDLRAGKKPFCVVPTLGTTSSASVDPLAAVAEVAQRYGLWLHVDAAYAGPAAILAEHRHILNGAALADSLVLNPHKWLFTPMDLSVLYTRRPEVFRRALSLDQTPAYLKNTREESAVNFSDYSVALGRRFRSLKLWFVFRTYGRKGIERILREHIRMARELGETIANDPRFELSAPIEFSLVCFRLKDSDQHNRELLESINATGHAFITGTTLKGKFVLRIAIGNIGTSDADIAGTWAKIQELVSVGGRG